MSDRIRHQRRRSDRHPRYLLPILVILIALGTMSVLVTIQTGQQAQLAREASLQEAFDLLEDLDEQQNSRAETSRGSHHVICLNVEAIAAELDVQVDMVCPDHRGNDDLDSPT